MATKDEYGHVILPDNPRDGLPSGLVDPLEQFVIVEDPEWSFERAANLRDLLRELSELEEPDNQGDWLAAYAEPAYVAPTNAPVSESERMKIGIPRALLTAIREHVFQLKDRDEATLRVQCLTDLSESWLRLNADSEKLLGHLQLAHGMATPKVLGDAKLREYHAQAHRALPATPEP